MHKCTSVAFVVALILILSGCAHKAGPLSAEDVKSSRRVAVISDLGTRAYSVSLGVIAFGNRMSGIDVDHWNINDQISALAIASMKSNELEKVEELRIPKSNGDGPTFNRREEAIAEAARHGFDTVVFIYQGSLVAVPFFVPGYGVFQHTGHEDKVIERCHYAAYSISVNRVASRNQIGWDRAYRFPCVNRDEPGMSVKVRMIDYSKQELEDMRLGVMREIDASLVPALQRLNLAR